MNKPKTENIFKVLEIINKIDNINYINPDFKEIDKEIKILKKEIDKKHKDNLDSKK